MCCCCGRSQEMSTPLAALEPGWQRQGWEVTSRALGHLRAWGAAFFPGRFFFFLDRRAERERAETVFGKVKQCQFGRGPPPPSLGKKGGGGRAPKGRVCVCFLLLRRVGRQGERTTRRGALASRGSFLGCWGGGSCCLEWMSRPQYPGSKGTAALRRPRKKKGGAPRRRAGPECREQAGRGGR